MAIKIKKDRIEFTANGASTFTLQETGNGFSFDGVIEGTNIFTDGYPGNFFGFSGAGYDPPATPPRLIYSIEKFPFATNSNASNHGDLLSAGTTGFSGTSVSGKTSGYFAGGSNPSTDVTTNIIQKFLFVTSANAVDISDLTVARNYSTSQSSYTSGYVSGGYLNPGTPPFSLLNTIDKFPFSADTNATDVGDLTRTSKNATGQSSSVSGYTTGGYATPPGPTSRSNIIDKFPFATDSNATDVGDTLQVIVRGAGHSSYTFGYNTGGSDGNNFLNTIQKFPFSADTNTTDVGDLTQIRSTFAGSSSTTHGYTSGGSYGPAPGILNTIEKFPFAADSNATDVADLIAARAEPKGWQY